MNKQRKPQKERENADYSPDEMRAILDDYLSGDSLERIADRYRRTHTAVEHLIYRKIAVDYTGDNRRISPIDKMSKSRSRLRLSRKLNARELVFLRAMHEDNVPQRKAAVALAVPLETVKQNWPTTFSDASKNGHNKPKALPANPIEQPIDPRACLRQLIRFIGDDPDREGLKDTPDRVVRSYAELFAGYQVDPASVLKTFKDGACDELVLVKGISFTSTCEHHMLPFFGEAHVAYIPNGRIVGLSKLARLVEVFARRLQVQERLTEQITAALDEHVKPKGAACVIEARHSCMMCRGVKNPSAVMVTSSLTGQFRDAEVRQEFLSLIRG